MSGRHRRPRSRGRHRRTLRAVRGAVVAGAGASVGLAILSPPASADTVWDQLAQCESGGDWSINTGNGFYGGLQFSVSSWRAVGGSGLPSEASKAEQIMRAERLQELQGWGAWPACSAKLGLTGDPDPVQATPQPSPQAAPEPVSPGSGYEPPCTPAKLFWEQCDPSDLERSQPADKPEPKAADPQPAPEQEPVSSAHTSPLVDPVYPADNMRIKRGDTLSEIADEYGTSVARLVADNPRTVEDPDLIYPSEGLYVRSKK